MFEGVNGKLVLLFCKVNMVILNNELKNISLQKLKFYTGSLDTGKIVSITNGVAKVKNSFIFRISLGQILFVGCFKNKGIVISISIEYILICGFDININLVIGDYVFKKQICVFLDYLNGRDLKQQLIKIELNNIISIWHAKVYNNKLKSLKKINHNYSEGHLLELTFGLTVNNQCRSDFTYFELKIYSSKITLGDWGGSCMGTWIFVN